jgi:FkbM family methyltransferase
VVLDVGANIGALTIPFAALAAQVHAVEPQPELADALDENVRRAGHGRVTVYRAACGAAPGTIRLPVVRYDQPGNFGGLSMGGDGAEVPVMAIDTLALPRVDLMKIDVEGAELSVLAGAAETVDRCRPVCYVEADRKDQAPGLLAWFKARKYVVEWHQPPLYSPENHAGNPYCAPHLRNVVSLNLWCTPL